MSQNIQSLSMFLGSILSGTPNKSLPLINGARVRSRTIYIAGSAADLAANNGETILPGTKKATGVTNLENGNILPKGSKLVVTGVRVLFDTTVSATLADALYKSSTPAPFKNGELTISQDGQGVLFNASGSDVTNDSTTTIGNNRDFREITPFLLRADTSFNVTEKLAAGSLANILYKIELRCEELIDEDKA